MIYKFYTNVKIKIQVKKQAKTQAKVKTETIKLRIREDGLARCADSL